MLTKLDHLLKFTCTACGGRWKAYEDAKNCHGIEPCTRESDCASISHFSDCLSMPGTNSEAELRAEIERLKGEVERLRADRESEMDRESGLVSDLENTINGLRDRNATARADAIGECVKLMKGGSDSVGGDWTIDEAAAALQQLKEGEG
jgi:hypothetical protein